MGACVATPGIDRTKRISCKVSKEVLQLATDGNRIVLQVMHH
jgi:hypothetical protein